MGKRGRDSSSDDSDDSSRRRNVKPQISSTATTSSITSTPSGTKGPTLSVSQWSAASVYVSPAARVVRALRAASTAGCTRKQLATLLRPDDNNAAYRRTLKSVEKILSALGAARLITSYDQAQGRLRQRRFCLTECALVAVSSGQSDAGTSAATSEAGRAFQSLRASFEQFERLSGGVRYASGDSILITDVDPDNIKLRGSRLLLTDTTMRRVVIVMQLLEDKRVVIDRNAIHKHLSNADMAAGLKHVCDRRSLMRILFALRQLKLLHIYDASVSDYGVRKAVRLYCHRLIDTLEEAMRIVPTLDVEERSIPRYPKKPKLQSQIVDVEQMSLVTRVSLARCSNAAAAAERHPQNRPSGTEEAGQDVDAVPVDEQMPPEAATPPEVATGPGTKKGSRGCVSRMLAAEIVHMLMQYLTYGYKGNGPDFFRSISPYCVTLRTVPDVDAAESDEQLPSAPHVYLDELTWRRYLPPLPKYTDVPAGWMLLYDLCLSVPLSLYVMLTRVEPRVPHLDEYLRDPERRHYLLCHLPASTRRALQQCPLTRVMKDTLMIMSAMGLVSRNCHCDAYTRQWPNQWNLFNLFYMHPKAMLYDTSNSEPGYRTVTPPLSRYKSYTYAVRDLDELAQFWLHLRIVAACTPLGRRKWVASDCTDYRDFRWGRVRDLTAKVELTDNPSELGCPVEPRDGLAGFFAGLYHGTTGRAVGGSAWRLPGGPDGGVGFMTEWRERASKFTPALRHRVANLALGWDAFISGAHLTFPSSSNWLKQMSNTKSAAANVATKLTNLARRVHGQKGLGRKRKTVDAYMHTRGKAPLDQRDVDVHRKQVAQRVRFTNHEREMLLFIRALSYFLCPMYRIWFSPTTVRDLMHEHVPESRNKTSQVLMAGMVRFLARSPAHLQHVRSLVQMMRTFPEMRELRVQSIPGRLSMPLSDEQKHSLAFKGFGVAMSLVHGADERVPPVLADDQQLGLGVSPGLSQTLARHSQVDCISAHIVTIGAESSGTLDGQPNVYVVNSQKLVEKDMSLVWNRREPKSVDEIRQAVAANAVLSQCALTTRDTKYGHLSLQIFSQFKHGCLEKVVKEARIEGLLSTAKMDDDEPSAAVASAQMDRRQHGQTYLSNYYKHFFSHGYHERLMVHAIRCHRTLLQHQRRGDEAVKLTIDAPGYLSVVAALLCERKIEFEAMPLKKMLGRGKSEAKHNQKLAEERGYGSRATSEQLDLGQVEVRGRLLCQLPAVPDAHAHLSAVSTTLLPVQNADAHQLLDQCVQQLDVSQRVWAKRLYHVVDERGALGASVNELSTRLHRPESTIEELAAPLLEARALLPAGVSQPSLVTLPNAQHWFVVTSRPDDHARSLATIQFILSPASCASNVEKPAVEPAAPAESESEPRSDDLQDAQHEDELSKRDEILFSPRPWLKPDASVNLPVLKWMCEGILLQLHAAPAMTERSLLAKLSLALQPKLVLELLDYLRRLGCVERVVDRTVTNTCTGPFTATSSVSELVYWQACVHGLRTFAAAFAHVLVPLSLSNRQLNQ